MRIVPMCPAFFYSGFQKTTIKICKTRQKTFRILCYSRPFHPLSGIIFLLGASGAIRDRHFEFPDFHQRPDVVTGYIVGCLDA